MSAVIFAPFASLVPGCFVLGFVALVPWLLAQDRVRSLGEAAIAGVALAVAFVAVIFPWLPATAAGYAGDATATSALWALMLLAAPLLEPQIVVFALVRYLVGRSPRPYPALRAAIAGALAYMTVEVFVPKLFGDTLGMGLYPSRLLRQGADLTGVQGLSVLLLLVNESVAAAIRARRPRLLLGALGLIAIALGYGAAREAQISARVTLGPLVGLVQANITNYDKMRAEKGAFETVREILDTHFALSEELSQRPDRPELLVWPETVYPTTFGAPKSEEAEAFDAEIKAFAARQGTPLIFGAYDVEKGDNSEEERNAAFFLRGGSAPARYQKRMLFPLTEWVPAALESAWLREAMPWAGHFQRGPGAAAIAIPRREGGSLTVLPLICYDVLFPDFVAEGAEKGADLIVTLSNDAWFPDARAPRVHLVAAAFRSIETRLAQVRATNSGISALIGPDGEIHAATGFSERATLAGRLPNAGHLLTLMRLLGPLRGLLPLGLTLALLVGALLGRTGDGEAQSNKNAIR